MAFDVNDVWRVQCNSDGSVNVFDFRSMATSSYPVINELPEDVQHKLAALAILKAPPTVVVEDVGEKIEPDLYWVYTDSGA